MLQRPVAIDLTVCEQLTVEEKTHNITLVNCFGRLKVRQVPTGPVRMVIYARLTDGLVDGKITVKVLHPNTLEELLSEDKSATFSHPFQEFNAIFRQSLSFPVEGRFQIQLLADGDTIAQRTLEVSVLKEMS